MNNNSIIEQIKEPAIKHHLAKKGEISVTKRTEVLDKNIEFKNGVIYYKEKQCGSYDEAKRTLTIDQQKCLNDKGLNPITSHPSIPTDATIIIKNGDNTHIITTDNLGRKVRIENKFKGKTINNDSGTRVNDEQTKAKMYGDEDGFVDTDYKEKDQGGHATSAAAGSLKEMAFIFPQAYRVNNSEEWKEIEKVEREEYNKDIINFTTIQEFKYDGCSKRPKTIKTSIIRKNVNLSKVFNNSNSRSVPILANIPNKLKNKNADLTTSSKPSNKDVGYLKPGVMTLTTPIIPIKPFLIFTGIIILLFLFLWLKNIFPFHSSINQIGTNINENDNVEKRIQNNDLIKSKLSFSEPLDDLTKSITDISEFNSIVENQNIIPVIGSMFEYDMADITTDGKKILANFVREYGKIDIKTKLLIEGFTCTMGSEEYNQELAKKRADNLKLELIKLGVTENSIDIKSIGKRNFVSTENNNNDLILNRRSNITIIRIE